MATEVGSDIALIQDEDMLRKMWQQTEDFGKKKEIRMRMYKLREQRLKEFYTTGEMIQTETTSKRSSTRTHTESITDQGFMTMKTKEIRDSESPTEDYQRQSNANKNYYVSSKIDESDGNRGIVEIEQASSLKPNEEYTQNSLQTSMSSSTSTKWKSSQTTISVSEEVQKAEVNLNSKFIVNEQNNEDSQLTYDTSYNNSDSSNIDSKVTESISTTNVDNIKRDDNNKYSNVHQKVEETYTSNGEQFEPVSENISNADSNFIENTYISNISSNKSEHFEIATDNKIINELQKLDSYLSTQQSTTDSSTKSNSIVSNDDKIIKKVEDKVIDTSKEHIEGQYITTHQHSYQPPRISVDLSPSHDAFAKSLRSTPERSSPSPSRERISPERRFKSASPEKYRASPEKSGSPSKSLNYSTRRRLSSTQTKGLSKKRSITPTRGEKYDSSDDSDCSGATHGTYDKYKGCDAKKTLFKEEKKITSTSKYGQKSSSTSPVRREKSPGYSSEGSVGKEVRKSSPNVKNSSHESSPERSAFKPVNNYKTLITQQVTQDNKINRITQEDNVYTNNYNSKNKISADKHLIKVIKPEIDNDLNEKENENTESTTKNTENNIINLKNNSIQEKFITQEQVCISVEQVDTEKITTQPTSSNDINKSPRDKSPSKNVRKENKTKQDEFIENEKSNVVKQSNIINDVITIKPKEKSPVKEIKPVTKDTKKYPTIKSSENISYTSDIKSVTPSKKTISTVPSSIPSPTKKVVPSTLEKTPSKKNLIHKDSKDTLLNKTVKKDLSRDKMDIKITRSDSKTLIHKNSKERITPKMVVKKPSHELLVDKKTTISSRQKVTSPETKTKTLETIKILEKKDSKNKLKPSISPQSSQKKLVLVKSIAETKIVDSKKTTGNIYSKRIPSLNVTKPRTHTSPKSDINETPTRVTKPHTKTISTSSIAKPQIKKTTYYNSNKTSKVEITKNVGQKSNDLENELPPDNFESDTDLDDSTNKPKYIKNISSNSSTSSSSSDEDDEDRDDIRKIQDIDNIRIEAEEEYGKKMTNKDALLNVIVQLPPSSRESSPEYSARFGQPYCSVSDDASLPRYADVVSEPEDANDYSLHSNRYDVVTDLDEESNVTVADRVSKFLNNVNKQEEIQKTTEIPQSPQAVRKTKQIFESIAKGKTEETDINDVIKSETMNIKNEEVHDLSKINNTPSSVLTRKISGASDYKTRKDFFENKKSNDISEKVTHLTPTKITRSSSIKDRRASFETKIDKKTPLKDKTNVPRTKSPESKSSSPDRTTKTPIKISKTETFDVKVEEINRSRRLSGSKSVKDRTATFEKNEPTQKLYKENKTTFRHQVPNTPLNTSKISEMRIKTATVTDTKTADRVLSKRVRSPEKPSATDSIIKTNESTSKKVPSKSPDRKITETPKRNSTAKSPDRQITETPKRNSTAKSPDRQITETPKRNSTAKSPDRQITEAPKRNSMTKSPERSALIKTKEDTSENRSTRDTISSSSRQRATITTAKTEFGVTTKNSSTPKTTLTTTTTQSISIQNADDEVEIEEIFDLHILETMLEKAVGYDRRRRIRAQIRVVKRQLETNSGKATNTTTRVTKNFQDVLPAKTQKQSNVTVEKTENVKKLEVKKERSVSPQKTYANPIGNSRSPSPQKTLRSVVETRTPLPTQKAVRTIENERSNSSQKTVISVEKVQPLSSQKITPIEKVRSPSPQKITSTEKVRSPSPKKISVVQKQQDSRFNKNEKSSRNSTITSTSTTVTKTTKVKSEQVSSSSTNLYQEQNVTDLITSSYGVGPTDDNGRPLFGLRALRKTNANQSVVSETDSSSSVHYEAESRDTQASDQKNRSFGLRALQSENTYTVQESSSTVYQTASDQKGGVDQLITDHKGKPLFGLKALQSIGKNEEEPIYDDMPEPPVSPQLKDLVLKHEKHAKESSKLESQPRQKPKAKFRDSFILDTKDEGLYSTFEENGFTDPNEITSLRSIIKKSEDDQNNETIVKSKSQSTVFQSKSVMRSDGSGNVSVTQDFLKGELSSVNEQEPSGKLTRGHYTYQSPDNLDAKKGIAKVTTVTTAIGKDTGPQITEITEELSENDHVDGNKVVKRSRTNDKFENIQKRFSQESFSQDSRRSSKELNGHEKSEVSPQSTPRSSLVRGDSIKALQHKFQQATVSSSLKQNKTAKSDVSSNSRQVEEKTVTTKVNTTKNSGTATSFLDNNSRVTGVQDVLTRMRNADLVVESGDTHEDIEARALLNKFLGASVILHGMEQGNKSPASINTTSSAALVNQVEKQRAQKSPVIRKNLNEQELDNIWDEKQLQILLESCPDYDQRKKIRARLRQIMAEHKACTDVVALAGLTDNTTSNGKNEVTESNSTTVSSKTGTGSYVKTEVHTRTTTSSNRLTKANSVSSSPFAKFQQLERQNSAPNSQTRPCYKFTDPALARSASSIKDRLLNWVKAQTKEYKNLQVTNFSTCWSDGLAFCALIHHFYPEAFDYDKLTPEKRRENFEIAFKVAEYIAFSVNDNGEDKRSKDFDLSYRDEAGIAPLLDVEDMVVMRKPDWKCVFTYVQTFYRRFHNDPRSVKPSYFE